jgi:hypothetical protein
MINLKIVWASVEDKNENPLFLAERKDMVSNLISAGKVKNPVVNPLDKAFAVLSFLDMNAATEYDVFIRQLATKYNKTIISVDYL